MHIVNYAHTHTHDKNRLLTGVGWAVGDGVGSGVVGLGVGSRVGDCINTSK